MPAKKRRQATPEQRAQWAQQRQVKLADLHQHIVTQVATMTDGEQWRAWLTFAARFHTYSFNNTIAIWFQRPEATFVAGIKRWNQLGRHVRKGETGIAILAPITARPEPAESTNPTTQTPTAAPDPAGTPGVIELTGTQVAAFIEATLNRLDGGDPAPAGRVLRGFKVATVFDISQTEGPNIDIPTRPDPVGFARSHLLEGHAPHGVWDALVGIAHEHGYRVERGSCDGANGYIRYAEHLIKVRDDVDDAQAVKTLAHELGHMLLHNSGDFLGGWTGQCRGEQEVEAESTAFLTAAHVGLDTSTYTFGYVAGWAERAAATTGQAPHELVQASGVRVVRAASTLTAALDDALGHAEPPVPQPLRDKVAAGTHAAATVRATAEAATVTAASQAQPALFDTPAPAATRAFPPAHPQPAPGPACTAAAVAHPQPIRAAPMRRGR